MTTLTAPEPLDVAAGTALPTVTLVVVNFNGKHHLESFLPSVQAMTYPKDLVDIVVVDNGSTDGSFEWLQREHPTIGVHKCGKNEGFASGVNIGSTLCHGEFVALLNNDMMVEPDWLERMVEKIDLQRGVSCVASSILDWDGTSVDFIDAALNFHGFGQQLGYQLPLDRVEMIDGAPLPFACGGAMLVHRARFHELGGFDPGFFAYFEDVDFGWRLRLAGDDVVLAAKARVKHRHHGTSGSLPEYQRLLLLERNALRMLYKNLGAEALGPVMAGAMMLLAKRASIESGIDRGSFNLGAKAESDRAEVNRYAMARLAAVADVVDDLEGLTELRRQIQTKRARGDRELFTAFKRPFEPLGSGDPDYIEAFGDVRRAFGLEQLFDRPVATRVAVLAYDHIGARMAGPSVRCWEIAKELGKHAHVTVLSEKPIERSAEGVHTARFDGDEDLLDQLGAADVVLVHGYALQRYPLLRHTKAILVVDLYDPWVFELLEMQGGAHDVEGDWIMHRDIDIQRELLDVGDFFICASERQRDYWMGMLTARDRLDRATYKQDPTLRSLIDIVPYGCPSGEPVAERAVLKGVHPAIGTDDIVVLWTGGAWQWFDPQLALRAFIRAHQIEPRLRLYVMGGKASGEAHLPIMESAQMFAHEAEKSGLVDEAIVFGPWVDYDERVGFLLEADMAVITTKDVAETRLAFRSRVLDHYWTGLPTITTDGDILAVELQREGAGIVVPVGDEDALTAAILDLATDETRRSEMGAAATALASRYTWSRSIDGMRAVLERPWQWRELRAVRPRPTHLTQDVQVLQAMGGTGRKARKRNTRHVDFHPRGPILNRMKRSGLYPFMRKVRRSGFGLRVWGPVPGE